MYPLEVRGFLPTRIVRVRRPLLCSLLLATASAVVLPAADLSIPPTYGSAGATVTAPVQYRAEKASIAALQFDLLFDSNVMSISATVGSAAAAAGKTAASNLLAPGVLRVIVFGINQNVIGNGSVVDLAITLNPNARRGAYSLDFQNVVGASPNAQEVPIGARSGTIISNGK